MENNTFKKKAIVGVVVITLLGVFSILFAGNLRSTSDISKEQLERLKEYTVIEYLGKIDNNITEYVFCDPICPFSQEYIKKAVDNNHTVKVILFPKFEGNSRLYVARIASVKDNEKQIFSKHLWDGFDTTLTLKEKEKYKKAIDEYLDKRTKYLLANKKGILYERVIMDFVIEMDVLQSPTIYIHNGQ